MSFNVEVQMLYKSNFPISRIYRYLPDSFSQERTDQTRNSFPNENEA